MIERDKYLTEAMGECWHEPDHVRDGIFGLAHKCRKCDSVMPCVFTDFSTWQGFGQLWDWAKVQQWWACAPSASLPVQQRFDITINVDTINPDRFANAVYEFLKGRDQ